MTGYFLWRNRAPSESEAVMKYISTRGQAPELTFEEAMLTGLARDGGLYLPAEIPVMTQDEIAAAGRVALRRDRVSRDVALCQWILCRG